MSTISTTIYKTYAGKEPFTTWLMDLDATIRSIVIARLRRVALGNFGDCKQLKNAGSIWELRIDHGAGYRIYFGKEGNSIIILLLGGDKRSQARDITKATQYWLSYKG